MGERVRQFGKRRRYRVAERRAKIGHRQRQQAHVDLIGLERSLRRRHDLGHPAQDLNDLVPALARTEANELLKDVGTFIPASRTQLVDLLEQELDALLRALARCSRRRPGEVGRVSGAVVEATNDAFE
jgi:hypothetical protein